MKAALKAFVAIALMVLAGTAAAQAPANSPFLLVTNSSTTTPLASGATFTGTAQDVLGYDSVVVAVLTDQAGTLYVDFSPDGTNWDSSLSYAVAASLNDVHRLTVTRRYMRARFTNTAASAQTYLRMQVMAGFKGQLSAPLNLSVQQDADSIVARTNSTIICDVSFRVREFGSTYQIRRLYTVGNSVNANIQLIGAIRLPEKTDVKMRAETCSANAGNIVGEWAYFLVKN